MPGCAAWSATSPSRGAAAPPRSSCSPRPTSATTSRRPWKRSARTRWASTCCRSARSPARVWRRSRPCSVPGGRRPWSGPRGSASPAWPTHWPAAPSRGRTRSGMTGAGGTPPRPASCTCCPAAGCSSTPPACGSWRSTTTPTGSRPRTPTSPIWPPPAGSATAATVASPGARSPRRSTTAGSTRRGSPAGASCRWRRTASCCGSTPAPGPRRGLGCAPASAPTASSPTGRAPAADRSWVASRAVRVLVIGSGAREHALCVALSSDPAVTALACAPGNAGTRAIAEPLAVDAADPVAVASVATGWRADLVVVGPEVPLVHGAADAVRDAGIPCFGPSQEAAQLEGSKSFAKHVMDAAGVPTARAWPVGGPAELETVLDEVGAPYVVKDDGLAAGKGVLVTDDRAAAFAHGRAVLDAGHAVLVEEFLDGPEVSLFAVTDGTTVLPLVPAQDHKRRDDGDGGPNTGGMGAYAPLPWAPPGLVDEVLATVLQPTVDEMARRGETFSGLLYAGLALTSRGVRVVEFNARFGDPETQVVLPLLETPLAGLLHAAATGTLAEHPPLRWRDGAAVTVVVAAPGYPESPRTGSPVTGADGEGVLHAGTAVGPDGTVLSAGGRVLSVVGLGPDLAAARQAAYERVAAVRLADAHWRTDIALAAVEGRIKVG